MKNNRLTPKTSPAKTFQLSAVGFGAFVFLLMAEQGTSIASVSSNDERPTTTAYTLNDRLRGAWTVKLEPDDASRSEKARPFDDTFTFDQAFQFSSAFFAKQGFKPVSYEDDTRGLTSTSFTVKAESETGGKLVVEGFGTGADLRGTLKWTKPDGTEWTFSYQGTRKG